MEQMLNPGVNGEQYNAQGFKAAEQSAESLIPKILADGKITIDGETRNQIEQKIAELKTKFKVKKVFVIVVKGDVESGEKPYYIGYFKRPDMMNFSQYMSFVQKDIVQANYSLASNIFIGGDKELIENEDLFLYGTMQQLGEVIEARSSDIVKK